MAMAMRVGRKTKVLLTGLVGGEIARQLLAAHGKYEVVAVYRSDAAAAGLKALGAVPFKGDVQHPEPLSAEAAKCDAVLHLAYIHDFTRVGDAIKAELAVVDGFIKALSGSGSQKTLITTTGFAMFAPTDGPCDETALVGPMWAGGRGKAEAMVLESAKQGVRGMSIRLPTHVWGPGKGTQGTSAFVQMNAAAAAKSGEATYVGAGVNVVSVLHVEDAARAYVLALERGEAGNAYHACGQDVTGKGIAEGIQKGLGLSKLSSITLEQNKEIHGEFMGFFFGISCQGNSNKARKKLGWEPKHTSDFFDGIAAAGAAGKLGGQYKGTEAVEPAKA